MIRERPSAPIAFMETFRLPFEIIGLYAGCAKIEGIAIFNPESVTLEYRVSDTIIGAWSGEINTRKILWTDLERVECGVRLFSPWMLLSARTLTAFDKLPSPTPAQLRLSIPWKHRSQLRTVTSEINLLLSYHEADRYRERLPGNAT